MNTNYDFSRRETLGAMAGAAASYSFALSQTTQAAESPESGLGLAFYVLNARQRLLKAADPKQDLFAPLVFLDDCRKLGAGGMQVPLGVLAPETFAHLRAKADEYGMYIEGIAKNALGTSPS